MYRRTMFALVTIVPLVSLTPQWTHFNDDFIETDVFFYWNKCTYAVIFCNFAKGSWVKTLFGNSLERHISPPLKWNEQKTKVTDAYMRH